MTIATTARWSKMLNENLLNQEHAAEYIGVKPTTLSMWRHKGRGPKYLKIGRSCFYRSADIEEWLDAQCVIPMPAETENHPDR
jgi:predicted DNA-binding transcriptional regulator AlpA